MRKTFIVVAISCLPILACAQVQNQSAQQLQQQIQALHKVSASIKNDNLTPVQARQLTQQTMQQTQSQQAQTAATSASTPQATVAQVNVNKGDMSGQAFAGVVEKKLPLTPAQIELLHKAFDQAQKAAANPPHIPPRPSTSAIQVNLSPHATPPIVRLGAGYISSLVFVDATGQPWPIQAYSVGDPTSYNIQWNKKGNTLLVQADTFYKRSNLAVILRGLSTPIMLTLLPGQSAVDYRVDLRIPALGPNAQMVTNGLPDGANPLLLSVLNGVPPAKARTLTVHGSRSTDAWLLNNRLYVRTNLEIVSPAWNAVMSSVDGTHAYELQPTSVILALQHGRERMVKLILEGLS